MHPVDTPSFRAALADYRILLERDYPQRALLALVGDRHRLTRDQRTVLVRGVTTRAVARLRRQKRRRKLSGQVIHADALNVLFTVSSYMLGKCLFIGTDGYLRDAAEDHGKARGTDMVERSAALILSVAAAAGVARLDFYVDAPVSHSGRTAEILRVSLRDCGVEGSATVAPSADYMLKQVRAGLIATSDSAVIDAASVGVIDLARVALDRSFRPTFLRLDQALPLARTRRSSISPG